MRSSPLSNRSSRRLGINGITRYFPLSSAILPRSTSFPSINYQSNYSVGYTMRNMRTSRRARENPPTATHSEALLRRRPPRSQQPSKWAMPKQQDSPIPQQTLASNNSNSNSGLHRRHRRTISAHASTAHSSHRPHLARSYHHPHHHLRSRARPRTGSIHIWALLTSHPRWLPLPLLWPWQRRLILNLGNKARQRSLDSWSGDSRGSIKIDWTVIFVRSSFFSS